MVAEKQAAAVQACFAFTKPPLRGEIGSASAASVNVFKEGGVIEPSTIAAPDMMGISTSWPTDYPIF